MKQKGSKKIKGTKDSSKKQQENSNALFDENGRLIPVEKETVEKDIERVFVVKKDLTKKDRVKAIVDKYLRGEISNNEMSRLLGVIRPKELNHKSELTGYV